MSNKVTLITGASGFIGSYLAEELVRRGEIVRCLVRPSSDISFLKSLNVEICYGDLLDKDSLRKAVEGAEVVYHLAAQVRPTKVLYKFEELNQTYFSVNVQGTINLAEISREKKVEKFIFYSSVSAIGVGNNLNESSDCSPTTYYGRTKLEAEEYLLEMHKKYRFPVIIIRPGQVYGRRSKGMAKFFWMIKYGLFPLFGSGHNCGPIVHVDDIIQGTILAKEKAKPGSIYLLFENIYYFDYYVETIAQAIGTPMRPFKIPENIAYLIAGVKEIIEKLFNLRICPFKIYYSKGAIKTMASDWNGSIEKARNELGYNPRISIEAGMRDVILHLQQQGEL